MRLWRVPLVTSCRLMPLPRCFSGCWVIGAPLCCRGVLFHQPAAALLKMMRDHSAHLCFSPERQMCQKITHHSLKAQPDCTLKIVLSCFVSAGGVCGFFLRKMFQDKSYFISSVLKTKGDCEKWFLADLPPFLVFSKGWTLQTWPLTTSSLGSMCR